MTRDLYTYYVHVCVICFTAFQGYIFGFLDYLFHTLFQFCLVRLLQYQITCHTKAIILEIYRLSPIYICRIDLLSKFKTIKVNKNYFFMGIRKKRQRASWKIVEKGTIWFRSPLFELNQSGWHASIVEKKNKLLK